MKPLVPLFVFLAACSPPPPDLSPIRNDLAALRQEVQELRKTQQPGMEALAAMDDLTHEVKRLREKTAPAPIPAPAPVKEAALTTPLPSGSLVGGVGGTQTGVNDLYWILTRVAVDGEDRTVLALYQARGPGFKLVGVRWVGPDLQVIEYNQEKPHVRDILEELKKKK
jgi:hypothetical protein